MTWAKGYRIKGFWPADSAVSNAVFRDLNEEHMLDGCPLNANVSLLFSWIETHFYCISRQKESRSGEKRRKDMVQSVCKEACLSPSPSIAGADLSL